MATNTFLANWGSHIANQLDTSIGFTQTRPFAHRVLVPWILRTISDALPEAASAFLERVPGPGALTKLEFARAHYLFDAGAPAVLVGPMLLTFACFLGVCWQWRALCHDVPGAPRALADAMPVIALILLPLTYTQGGYVYDVPELLAGAVCCAAFVRSAWLRYYAVLPLAVLNKETAVVMGVWFVALALERVPGRWLAAHAALHALLGGGVAFVVWYSFSQHPGPVAAYFLPQNLRYFATGAWTVDVQTPYALFVPLPAALNVVNLGLVSACLVLGWRPSALRVRVALVSTIAVLVPLFVLFGTKNEIRVFALAWTPLLLVCTAAAARIYAAAERADTSR